MAGVVNFITKKDFEGFDLQYQFSTDEETGKGDANQMGIIWGVRGDRGGIVVSSSFLNRDEINVEDRYERVGGSTASVTGQPGRIVPRATRSSPTGPLGRKDSKHMRRTYTSGRLSSGVSIRVAVEALALDLSLIFSCLGDFQIGLVLRLQARWGGKNRDITRKPTHLAACQAASPSASPLRP